MIRKLLLGASVALAAACSPADEKPTDESAEKAQESKKASFAMPALPETVSDIRGADIGKRLEALASDTFEGRAPGTKAGEASAQWIADDMARVGLKPAVEGDWFQTVEMNAQSVDLESSNLTLDINGETRTLAPATETVFWTKRQVEDTISFTDSDLVFVGYGVVAPEYSWNDYEGLDVKGKTVVMMINDPGFATEDPALFNGKAMTYYGRWTYKFEEAARQGADAAIIIHETAPAAYGWNVVSGSWSGEQADLVRKGQGMDRIPMEAWITKDVAQDLFAASGLDYEALKVAAHTPGFKSVPMTGIKASGQINQTVKRAVSRNVAGMIEGSETPDEYVLYMAHWDHLGKKINFAEEDAIHNGAVDNASGVAVMLDIAEKFATGPAPKRSVVFMSVTLEESGLLGSAYFAENPFIPLNQIVSGVNMDGMLPIGKTKDMVVIGSGASELEDRLAELLTAQDRVVRPDPTPEKGYFYRSDHISLAKKGVPMLYADGGPDKVDGGIDAGMAAAADYTVNRYHKPSDEFDANWDMSGFEEDATIFYQLGHDLADSADWPNWYEGNEFRALRDAMMK